MTVDAVERARVGQLLFGKHWVDVVSAARLEQFRRVCDALATLARGGQL